MTWNRLAIMETENHNINIVNILDTHFKHLPIAVFSILCLFVIQPAQATFYPYDFGSFADQPRGLINNAALLFECKRSSAYAGRYRSNEFQPIGVSTSDTPSDPTDGNAIEAEGGLCRQLYPWLTTGAFTAISSFDGNQTTQSFNHPIVFPLHKTYLPVLSGAFSIKVIENVFLGFAAQFFETVKINNLVIFGDELRILINTKLGFKFNWNMGAAIKTHWGLFHAGYQPAFDADLSLSIVSPINLDQVGAFPINSLSVDLLTLASSLDYRPATWQLGWNGHIQSVELEAGLLISAWDKLGAHVFVQPSDPVGLSEFIFPATNLKFRRTTDPYFLIKYPLTQALKLQGGYAHFQSPLKINAERSPAVSGDIHSFKVGGIYKTYLKDQPTYLEGHYLYGKMPLQNISGGGQVSGNYSAFMLQISFPF